MNCRRLSWVAEFDNGPARALYDSAASCKHVSYRIPLQDLLGSDTKAAQGIDRGV
jgi:hypothetical protein